MATTPYLFSIFLIMLSSADASIKPSKGVTLQLVHRFSPSLSFHKPDNFVNFLHRNDEHVIKRIAILQQDSIDVKLITPTSGQRHLFFVNLSIGEPPVTQYLAMDTGSRLTWVIGDYVRRQFKYASRRSSTFSYVTCGSDICKKLSGNHCNSNGKCIFRTSNGDSQHYLVYDRFVFENSALEKVIMGVNYKGNGRLFREANFYGIFALSPRYPSFMSRLADFGAKKFSYYINGKVTDSLHPYARLTLGDADIQGGATTPLHIDGGQYRLDLECISLGEECLDIDPKLFAKEANKAGTGVIIDSGSISTYVVEKAYEKLYPRILEELERRGFNQRDSSCFHGSVEDVKKTGFPVLSFDFAEGASLRLDEDALFINYGSVKCFCLTVKSSAIHGPTIRRLTIIGLTAQQEYVMGYDLENLRLSMKESNFRDLR